MKSDSIHCFSRCRKKWLMFTLTKCQNRQASVATVTSVHLERRRKCDGVTGSTEAEGRGGKLAQVNAVTLHGLCSNTQMKLCCGCGRRIRTCLHVWFWRAVTTCFCPLSYKWHNKNRICECWSWSWRACDFFPWRLPPKWGDKSSSLPL